MEGSTLDDVLGLTQEAILNRRLETLVQRKGLAATCKQARQFIVHGHVSIDGRKVTIPGYVVKRSEEDKITYNPQSPISNELHPLRTAPQQGKPHEVANVEAPKANPQLEKVERVLKKVAADVVEDVEPADLPEETDVKEE
jgi:small subunit ribosomal protein S4